MRFEKHTCYPQADDYWAYQTNKIGDGLSIETD
jgi:hypothetical protein